MFGFSGFDSSAGAAPATSDSARRGSPASGPSGWHGWTPGNHGDSTGISLQASRPPRQRKRGVEPPSSHRINGDERGRIGGGRTHEGDSVEGTGPVRADRHRRADEARPRRGAGARPPRRHLRHRHQRLPRQDAVLQLPAHPRPRARRRGAGGRPRRGQRPAGRPLLRRAVHQLPDAASPAGTAAATAARTSRSSASTPTAACGRASSCRPASCTRRSG